MPTDMVEREALETDFERVIDDLGHVPSRDEYAEHGEYEMTIFTGILTDTFLYADAVSELGYDLSDDKAGRGRAPISESDFRSDFERIIDEIGHVPSATEYESHSKFSRTSLINHFAENSDSYYEAIDALGYEYSPPRLELSTPEGDTEEGGDGDRSNGSGRGYSVSDEELRTDFERVVDELGRTPTPGEYKKHGKHSLTTIAARFGNRSYNAAVEALGYEPPSHGGGRPPIPDGAVVEEFERIIDDIGRVPTLPEYKERSDYTYTTLLQRLVDRETSSYYEGLERAGYDVPDPSNHASHHSAEELREDFERIVDELGRVPSKSEYDEHGVVRSLTFAKRFGERTSYYDAVENLGYDPTTVRGRPPVSKQRVIEDFERVVERLGRVPSSQEYAVFGAHSPPTLAKRVLDDETANSFNAAVEALGYEPQNSSGATISDDDIIADFERVMTDLRHTPSTSEYNKHGRYSTSTLVNRFSDDGSYDSAVENMGFPPRP